MSAYVIFIAALMLLAAGLAVAGVYVLVGLGWSLICGAVCSFLMSSFLLKGANSG